MPRDLARSLGRADVLAVVMGAIVGVGIFFQPGAVARLTGSAPVSLAAWVLGGVIALAGALTFSELGCLFPATGGQYLILRETYGRAVGFLYCWALLGVIVSGAIGIIAILCIRFLSRAAGVELGTGASTLAAIALIALLALVNASGVSRGAALARVAMLFKALAIAAIAAIGLLARPAAASPAAAPSGMGDGSWSLLLPALIPVLFSFGGWQQATFLAGEVKEPGKTLPFGIIGGVLGVVALHLGLNLGYLSLLGVERMAASKALAADAVAAVLPGTAERLVSLAVAVSALGITSVCLMTTPRMYKAIADDGCILTGIGRVHPGLGTPANAIFLQAGCASLLLLLAGFDGVDKLTTGVVCLDWVFFTLTGIALFVLRRRLPDAPRPYRARAYPVAPGLFVLAGAGAVVASFLDPATRSASFVALIVLATGGLAYAWFRRRADRHE
jgi:APA family basic amino acid/polyamine antiporter